MVEYPNTQVCVYQATYLHLAYKKASLFIDKSKLRRVTKNV